MEYRTVCFGLTCESDVTYTLLEMLQGSNEWYADVIMISIESWSPKRPSYLITIDEPGQIGRRFRVVRRTVSHQQVSYPVVRLQSTDERFAHWNVWKCTAINRPY